MTRKLGWLGLVFGAAVFAAGCTTAPRTEAGKERLDNSIDSTMKQLREKDPGIDDFLSNAYAYAIFPTVGKGGAIVGGSYGHGEVYQGGKKIGYADISQATIGAQIGGEAYTEILAFESEAAFDNFKKGSMKFAANASAVALKSGVARTMRYSNGVAVFVNVKSGAMAEAAVGGQSFSYQPL